MRNQPSVIRPLKAGGSAYPKSNLVSVLPGSACSNEHGCHRDVPTRQDGQVVDFLADRALKAIEPVRKPIPERGGADVLKWRHDVEVDDVGRVKGHQSIEVPGRYHLAS